MATEVVMPQMGESIAEGTISKWLVKVGQKVERDQPLFEISTDKVDAEIPSPASGVVLEIRHPQGATVAVNTVVGLIGAEGEQAAAAPAQPAAAAAAPPPPAAAVPAPAPAAPAPPTSPPPRRPLPLPPPLKGRGVLLHRPLGRSTMTWWSSAVGPVVMSLRCARGSSG